MADETVGTIHPEGTMFLRTQVGEAKNENGQYSMTYSIRGTPIVQSYQTGKYWTLDWQEILGLAIKAGIDKPDEPEVSDASNS